MSAGQLSFNVTAPLSASESLNIRTSTMVTGIRGTSGYVSVRNASSSTVTITDGEVQVRSADAAGENQSAEVRAGQTGVASVRDDTFQITVTDLHEEDIPGFVAMELQKDANLQQRVEAATDLPVTEIAARATSTPYTTRTGSCATVSSASTCPTADPYPLLLRHLSEVRRGQRPAHGAGYPHRRPPSVLCGLCRPARRLL